MTKMRGNPWAILLVLSLAYFLTQLDVAVLAVAIPSVMADLDASTDQVVWSISAYIFVLAVVLITAGRLGDLYGRRRLFLIGVLLFTFFSLTAGLAETPGQLIAARAAQGLGAALLTPQTLALLVEFFPADKRGMALGIRGAVGGVAAVTGPVVGGVLVSALDWRWVFLVNAPLGVAMLVLAWLVIPETRPERRHRLDILGVLIVSAALFCLTFAISQGEQYAWSGWIWALLIASGVLFAVFVVQQRARQDREPLVPFELFRNRNYALMNAFSLTTSGTVIGLVLVLSIFLQSVLGMDPLAAGLVIVPASLLSTVFDPVAGKLSDRVQGKYLLLVGAVLTAGGMLWAMTAMYEGADWRSFVLPMSVIGIGNAFLFTPLAVVALGGVGPKLAGAASGVLVTALQIGSMMGAAAVGAVLQGTGFSVTAGTARTAMLLLVGVAALGAIACLAARPNLGTAPAPAPDPAPTDGEPVTTPSAGNPTAR